MRDVHVTLPDSLADETDRLASDLGESRNGLIRRALEELIAAARKRKLAAKMKVYAELMSQHSGELVEETGSAVAQKDLAGDPMVRGDIFFKACAALAHQVTTIDRGKLTQPALGRVTGTELAEVDEALRSYLNL